MDDQTPKITSEKQEIYIKNFQGIDKDKFLSRVAKEYMAIISDGRSGVFCENGLEASNNWKKVTRDHIRIGAFDVIVTNLPFGKKLKIDDTAILGPLLRGKPRKSFLPSVDLSL